MTNFLKVEKLSKAYSAARMGTTTQAVLERLHRFPESGRMVPERRDAALREVVAAPYRIVYRRRSDVVDVVTVFRASRRFPELAQ